MCRQEAIDACPQLAMGIEAPLANSGACAIQISSVPARFVVPVFVDLPPLAIEPDRAAL
jgi:hypothetical protein